MQERVIKMQNVNKHTRAGDYGKKIACPHCNDYRAVGHFAWSAMACPNCKAIVNKCDWLVVPKSKPMNGAAAKKAWLAGHKVFWKSEIYTVYQDNIGQWLNKCIVNDYCVGVGDTETGYYTHGKRAAK